MVTGGDGEIIHNLSYEAYGKATDKLGYPAGSVNIETGGGAGSSGAKGSGSFPALFVGGAGIRYDVKTNLHYMRFRWFSPDQMRFISKDLLMDENRYAYVSGNPISFIDPTGLRYKKHRRNYWEAYIKANPPSESKFGNVYGHPSYGKPLSLSLSNYDLHEKIERDKKKIMDALLSQYGIENIMPLASSADACLGNAERTYKIIKGLDLEHFEPQIVTALGWGETFGVTTNDEGEEIPIIAPYGFHSYVVIVPKTWNKKYYYTLWDFISGDMYIVDLHSLLINQAVIFNYSPTYNYKWTVIFNLISLPMSASIGSGKIFTIPSHMINPRRNTSSEEHNKPVDPCK